MNIPGTALSGAVVNVLNLLAAVATAVVETASAVVVNGRRVAGTA